VKNATIRIKIEDTYVDHTLYSNQNGAFTVDFLGPESEGNYTLTVTAVKAPYISYSETRNIEIVNMPSLSIVFPGSVQVKENSTKDEDVFIVNTGQSRITGLRIETDLDENYYQVGEVPDTLDMKQEVHIPIKFFGDGDIGTQSANLRIISNEFNQEKTFGFTILENMPAAQAVTGFAFSMPDMSGAYPIIAIAAGAFAAAFLLKKFRKSVHRPIIHMNHAQNEKRGIDDVSLYLNDVKTHLRRKT
jgi:hypothetical protein